MHKRGVIYEGKGTGSGAEVPHTPLSLRGGKGLAREIVTDLYRDIPIYPKKKLIMTLPLPVSINHMYMNTHGGGKKLNARAETYVRDARGLINLAIEEQHWKKQLKSTWYYIDLVFYLPDRGVLDSHNMIKLLLDTMQGYAFDNDYYIMPRIQSVEYDKHHPRVKLYMSPQLQGERQLWLKRLG